MYLLLILLSLIFICALWAGYQRMVRLRHLNRQRVIYGFLTAMVILTVMTAAHRLGFLSQLIAARFTMALYTLAAGFFFGFASKQYRSRQQAGDMEYAYRSFWTESAPNLVGILLIAFGLYRTQLFTLGPFTGIGVSSGLSLIAFGMLGLTIRIVPEFRRKGILILDELVSWPNVVAYRWHREDVLRIEYLNSHKKITDFRTAIPEQDHLIVERLLGKKLQEHEEERKKTLQDDEYSEK